MGKPNTDWLNYETIKSLRADQLLLLEFFIKRKNFFNINFLVVIILVLSLIIYIRKNYVFSIIVAKR